MALEQRDGMLRRLDGRSEVPDGFGPVEPFVVVSQSPDLGERPGRQPGGHVRRLTISASSAAARSRSSDATSTSAHTTPAATCASS